MRLRRVTGLARRLRASGAELLDALYPPVCWLCRAARSVDGFGCAAHALLSCAYDPAQPRCSGCALALPEGIETGLCACCRRRPRGYGRVLAFGPYRRGSALREWILAFKHGGRRELARPLGAVLARELSAAGEWRDALLVPVPLHPLRRLERGYDQAALLSVELAEASGLDVAPVLRRRRWTPPQGAAGARSRAANVHEAFEVAERHKRVLARRVVLLVDDVVTSGATVAACAAALRAARPSEVSVVALARAPLDSNADPEGEAERSAATLTGSAAAAGGEPST